MMRRLRSVVAAALLNVALPAQPAGAEELPVVDALFAPEASRKPLAPAIPMIAEADFDRLLAKGRSAATRAVPDEAVRLTASFNDASGLGVEGQLLRSVTVDAALFIVVRQASVTSTGTVQSSDFFVAAVPLRGEVRWAALETVVVASGVPSEPQRSFAGCAPLDTSRPAFAGGLPSGVTLNLEARARPRNASARTIALYVFDNSDRGAPGEIVEQGFVCGAPTHVSDVSGKLPQAKSIPKFESALRLPPDAVVISERDFYSVLAQNKEPLVSKESMSAAARILTAANDRSALGLQARAGGGARRFSSSFVVVARDAVQRGGLIAATEFYVVPMTVSGEATWVGRDVRLGFGGELPTFDLDTSPCGLVFGSRVNPGGAIPSCGDEGCVGSSHPWTGQRGGFGLGPTGVGTRSTIRFFGRGSDGIDIHALVCTQFLTPPEREARQCGRTDDGRITAEICNGRDDDCDGEVDEGFVCDLLPGNCPPQPRTCGTITCSDIPDGIGGVVSCPCP